MLISFRKLTSFISNYRYDFGPKLLEFLGVNTKIFGEPGRGFTRAYEEDLELRQRIYWRLSHKIDYKENMYGHEPNKKEKEILKKYSDLEIEQDEWDLKNLEEGREQYLKECAAMNISLDD